MNPAILNGILQTVPIWSLSLIAFIPLTAKLLNHNKEIKSGVVSWDLWSSYIQLFVFVFLHRF